MQRYIALLRGINLGKRRMPMSRLRELFEGLGYEEVATFIASGNVLFTTRQMNATALEAEIAAHLAATLGYQVDTFVRTPQELTKIVEAELFADQDEASVNVHIALLHQKLPAATARKLTSVRTATDSFRVVGREIYWRCLGRMSDSTVWTLPKVKALRLPTSTMRSRKSLRKLIAKHLA